MQSSEVQHVFLVGAKSLGAYGGYETFINKLLEYIERAGIHSGDSISVYPAQTLSQRIKRTIIDYTGRLARALKVVGLVNIQYVIYNDTEYHQNNPPLKYHVACKANGDGIMDPYKTLDTEIMNDHEFTYHNAHCFRVKIPEKLGPAQAIYYDVAALKECCKIIREQSIPHP